MNEEKKIDGGESQENDVRPVLPRDSLLTLSILGTKPHSACLILYKQWHKNVPHISNLLPNVR